MRDFKQWYRSLNAQERQAYADRAGVSRKYIEVSLVFRRRTPKPETMRNLADATLGRLTYEDIVRFFLLDKEVA